MKATKISALASCLLVAQSLLAQYAPAPDSLASRPVTSVTFDSSFYDFGTVRQGEVVTRVFHFTNTGTDSLVIAEVKTTCGCTVPEWPQEPIAPGGTGAIKVEFNTADKAGRQLRILRVFANTEPPESILQLGGEIKVQKKKTPTKGQ